MPALAAQTTAPAVTKSTKVDPIAHIRAADGTMPPLPAKCLEVA